MSKPVDWNVVGPELLEVLRDARDFVSDVSLGYLIGQDGEGFIEIATESLNRVDAAIQKATGG